MKPPHRIFLYEHLSAIGGTAGEAQSLAREGEAMLLAIVEDFARVPGVAVHFAWSQENPLPPTPPNTHPVNVSASGEVSETFEHWAGRCDATLLIAPELDGELERLALRAEACGARLLGPGSQAIHEAADKLTLPDRLTRCDIPAVPAALPGEASFAKPWVVKPRFGAGATRVEVVPLEASASPADGADGRIATPYVPGRAASVAALVGPRDTWILPPCTQRVRRTGARRESLVYDGGAIPLASPDEAARARALGRRTFAALSGLRGFVGVDLLLGESTQDDVVVEVNPRLTTSYLGLRALAEQNLAALWLDVVAGQPTSAPRWQAGALEFASDGRIEALERC